MQTIRIYCQIRSLVGKPARFGIININPLFLSASITSHLLIDKDHQPVRLSSICRMEGSSLTWLKCFGATIKLEQGLPGTYPQIFFIIFNDGTDEVVIIKLILFHWKMR